MHPEIQAVLNSRPPIVVIHHPRKRFFAATNNECRCQICVRLRADTETVEAR